MVRNPKSPHKSSPAVAYKWNLDDPSCRLKFMAFGLVGRRFIVDLIGSGTGADVRSLALNDDPCLDVQNREISLVSPSMHGQHVTTKKEDMCFALVYILQCENEGNINGQ